MVTSSPPGYYDCFYVTVYFELTCQTMMDTSKLSGFIVLNEDTC